MIEEQNQIEDKKNEDMETVINDTVDGMETVLKKGGKTFISILTEKGYDRMNEFWQKQKGKLKLKIKEGLKKNGENE